MSLHERSRGCLLATTVAATGNTQPKFNICGSIDENDCSKSENEQQQGLRQHQQSTTVAAATLTTAARAGAATEANSNQKWKEIDGKRQS
mmetsp:Transcript_27803/g.58444  ORF Transcript_27803/g.58444 Transcript_27803/m.58444 type:complete len:90 (-) Transcript_27803:318-587(-)